MAVNLPFLLCFTLSLREIFQVQAPGGLIFGGACTWSGLFSEFYGICKKARELRHNNFMGQGESVLCNFAERAPMPKGSRTRRRRNLDVKDRDLEIEKGQAGLP